MGSCMERNLQEISKGNPSNISILHGCGDYDFYGQIDAETSGQDDALYELFLPQHFHLEELHKAAPTATFLLNVRPPEEWAKSVMSWFGYGARFLNTFGIERTHDVKQNETKKYELLVSIYENHTKIVREFIRMHPSHALVEINIKDRNAGIILSQAFGLNKNCWSHHNPTIAHKSLQNNQSPP